jgi:hypothetical protein
MLLVQGIFGSGLLLRLLPCPRGHDGPPAYRRSAATLQEIGQALHNYHGVFKEFPPAVVRDKDGRSLYSWRVLLLPFLEHDHVYRNFKLDEPWDSPHNKDLLEPTPYCYWPRAYLDDPPGTTRYQMLVGPGTAFERPGLTWKDFPDGPAETILFVEGGEAVPWSKPADVIYDPNGPLSALGAGFTKPVYFLCNEVARTPGFNAVFGDGKVRFIRGDIEEDALRAVITRNRGEKVDLSTLE